MNSDRRPPEALLSEDVRLPYSKGLMARTLMGTGIRPERAYELARLIEGELVREGEEAAAPEQQAPPHLNHKHRTRTGTRPMAPLRSSPPPRVRHQIRGPII